MARTLAVASLLALLSVVACSASETQPPPATDPATAPAPATATDPLGPSRPSPPLHVDGEQLLDEVSSAHSTLRVRQTGVLRSLRFLSETGRETHQTTMNVERPERLHSPYAKVMFVSLLYAPEPSRVLIIGLGGGVMIQFIRHHLPDTQIDAVELDPEVVRVADRWFGVRPGPKTRIVTANGLDFLAAASERWDTIYLDTFLDPAKAETDGSGVPHELQTVAFLRDVDARLADGGVVAFNLHFKSSFPDHLRAIRQVFPHVRVFKVSSSNNRVVVASREPHPSDDQLHGRADALDGSAQWGFSFAALLEDMMDPLEPIAGGAPQ